MSVLATPLRRQLESAVLAARRAAESASRAALDGLGVLVEPRPAHLSEEQAALRRGLRAKWRQLGNERELLVAECAYEQWHRLLFARFLAENGLLLHPQYRAPVRIEECEELAAELGEPDGWAVAARFASEILPGIFRLDDPCVRLRLAPEGRYALEQILTGLPPEVFTADDALGWVYQFWQKDKKDEVNASERKIGGADLGPVTQLFTENYMVRFLLENSLGAWWAARYPDSPLQREFEYLRFDDEGKPAAGSFEGWPQHVAEVTVMDPCCGSGHFLVEAFGMLWRMRAEEEQLAPVEAQDAVLRDNLFGLELDPRCVQIAMFAVALQAWKDGRGWRPLPIPNIACSGIPVKAPVEEWVTLGRGDQRLETALVRLHGLFRDADTLGSLIEPRRAVDTSAAGGQRSMEDVDWEQLAPLLRRATERETSDPAHAVLGADAAGIAKAADLLSRQYTLVATNVPFLGLNKFASRLALFLDRRFQLSRHDLAYAMVDRCSALLGEQSSAGFVMPSEWLFLPRLTALRRGWWNQFNVSLIARLGYGAFPGVRANPSLIVTLPANELRDDVAVLDFDDGGNRRAFLTGEPLQIVSKLMQLKRADAALRLEASSDITLERVAEARSGLSAGDGPRFERSFWEVPGPLGGVWERLQDASNSTVAYGGRSKVVLWERESGAMAELAQSVRHLNHAAQNWRRGKPFWGRTGVVLNLMGTLRGSLYSGDRYGINCAAVVPNDESLVPALWEFAKSGAWEREVRKVNRKLNVSPHTVVRVPFDIDHWRKVAEEAGPLPEPWSDDPTQWLFEGRPEVSTAPLQVAVGRLLGYRWPEQAASDDLDACADADAIACLPSVAGEAPAAERLERVLATAYGESWSPGKVAELLTQAGSKKKSLADWLADEFFKQHCALFANRPFIWHIWDGQRDGFAALVNYHRLDRRMLEKLTYTYLGQDWVERQRADVRDELPGAEARLAAALGLQRRLEGILEGEDPFDIYVRWKALHEQPIGWEPEMDDGVRLNIRPFVEAGVLRAPFNIHWRTDRGKNPDGSERRNYVHLSLATKREARARAGRA